MNLKHGVFLIFCALFLVSCQKPQEAGSLHLISNQVDEKGNFIFKIWSSVQQLLRSLLK